MVKRCYFYSHFSDHPFCKGIYSNWLLYYSDWLRSGWAQPPALMRSFSCDSLLQIKVLAQNALKQLKTIPLCSTQSRSFCLKKKKNPLLGSHHMEVFLRTGSVGFMKLFRDSCAEDRPHFDLAGKWMLRGSVLESHHPPSSLSS